MPSAIYGLLVASACLIVAGCGASSPTNPFFASTPGPAPGVYTGIVADSSSGSGTVTVSLASAQGLTSGTWEMSFGGKADPKRFISGTVSGNAYTATFFACPGTDSTILATCSPNCRFSFAGSFTSSGLGGTYTAISDLFCPVRTGSINATKQ